MSDRITAGGGDPREGAPGSAPVPWFQGVAFYSLLAGLCPLIPVPFLDDRALAAVRRTLVRDLARQRGVALSAVAVEYLAGTYRVPRGCLARIGRTAYALTVKLVGKLFRKVLIFLAVKEGVDAASRAFHEGYLLYLLLDPAEPGTEAPADEAAAWRARWAIEGATAELDPRPIEQAIRRAFRGSRRLRREGARLLGRTVRRRGRGGVEAVAKVEEERLLGGLRDRLAAELWEQQGYLAALEARFLSRIAPPHPDPLPPSRGGEGTPTPDP